MMYSYCILLLHNYNLDYLYLLYTVLIHHFDCLRSPGCCLSPRTSLPLYFLLITFTSILYIEYASELFLCYKPVKQCIVDS
nr:MAG TPA: hypothetical protein [Caudoviricetes sp.]